jgi:hypothetical protein
VLHLKEKDFFGTDASEIKRPISEERKTLLPRMDTDTTYHFSRNRVLDFLRPASAGGGVSDDGGQMLDDKDGDQKLQLLSQVLRAL